MRLLVCLTDDFLSNYALNLLTHSLRGHEVHITLSSHIGSPQTPRAAIIREWAAYEWQQVRDILQPWCEQRGYHPEHFSTFPQLAAHFGGTLSSFANINGNEALGYVRHLAPDLILAIRFGQIFKPELIRIPRLGVLNLHAGLLPDYRGILANFWAMKHGKKEIGCTLHWITDGTIDTGDVVGMHHMPADYSRSVIWNIAHIYPGAAQLIGSAIHLLDRKESLQAQPQQGLGKYYSYPQDADIGEFKGTFYESSDYEALFEPYGLRQAALAD